VPEDDAAGKAKVKKYYEILRERIFRNQVIDHKRRPDGRAFDQIREIWIEAGVLPRAHGSAVFTRGETQALGYDHARHERRHAASGRLRR
jgi:polyribonucleotide nucleotidyltransferase